MVLFYIFSIAYGISQVFKQLYSAVSKYEEWKSANDPHYKPWRNPEQNQLPLVNLSTC